MHSIFQSQNVPPTRANNTFSSNIFAQDKTLSRVRTSNNLRGSDIFGT